jgi:PAS domain S-box-containing protein
MKTMRMLLRLPFGPLLFSAALLATLSVSFVGVRSLADSREATVRLAEVRSRNLVNSADQNITAMLNRIDHTLLSVVSSIERDLASGGLDQARMKHILTFEEKNLPEAVAIRVTNSEGSVILNNPTDNPIFSLADRPFFQYLKDHPEVGLFVTKPIQGLFTPKWAIPCARHYTLPDGRFGGIVVAPVTLEYFEGALSGYDVGPGGLRVLRDIDGGFITRYPAVVKGRMLPVGDKTISSKLQALIRSGVSQETYFSITPYDQTKRTVTFRRMKAAPFIVVAGLAEEDYLAQWYKDRVRTLAVVAAFIAGVWLMAGLLWRSWKGHESDAEALRESETKYRSLLNSLDALVYVADMTTHEILMLNKYGQTIFGDVAGKKCWQTLQTGQSGPCAFCTNDRLLLPSGEPAEPLVWEFQNTVNNRWYECRDQAIKWSDGRIVRMEIATDITERKRAEDALKKSEAFVKNILASVDEGFIVLDRDFRIISANDAYLRMVEKSEGEVIGSKCHQLAHGRSEMCINIDEDCPVRKTFNTGKSYISNHVHLHKGESIYVETKSYPVRNSEGEITSVILTITDVTEKRKLEEELVKTQKLDSIGILAGGIAHDFNNILTGILGYISLLEIRADQSLQGYITEVEKAVEQARSLTNQLLTFAKGGLPVKKLIQIRPVVESAVKLALSGTNVKYELGFDPDLKAVEADEGQIKQVIQNIVLNAAESMPDGGTVTVGLHNAGFTEDTLTLKAGNYLKITIHDTGIGIPPQYLSKIFDPYFTTKKKGSGLGLATAFSIIKKHGGGIDVASTEKQGTTFTIYLPATSRTVETVTSKTGIVYGKGKILILEDEDMVAAVAKDILITLGYSPDVAATGEDALRKYSEAMEKGEPYDAVILDLTIRGGMGGKNTMKGLLELNPAVKGIVASGYAQDPVMANYSEYGFKGCLMKPYRINELSRTLSDVISPKQ